MNYSKYEAIKQLLLQMHYLPILIIEDCQLSPIP